MSFSKSNPKLRIAACALNCFTSICHRMILVKFSFIFSCVSIVFLSSLKRLISFKMSSAKTMYNQHEQVKKYAKLANVCNEQNAAIASWHRASRKPSGVFQLNGSLQSFSLVVFDCFKRISTNLLTLLDKPNKMIHRPCHKRNNSP